LRAQVGRESNVHIFNVSSGKQLYALHGQKYPIRAIAQRFGARNKKLRFAANDENRFVRWNVGNGTGQ
jgi:hypothetical protein